MKDLRHALIEITEQGVKEGVYIDRKGFIFFNLKEELLPSAFDVPKHGAFSPMATVKLYEPGLKHVIRARLTRYRTRYLDTLFLPLITRLCYEAIQFDARIRESPFSYILNPQKSRWKI